MFQVTIAVFREFLEISILVSLFSAFGKNIKNFNILLAIGMALGCIGAGIIALFTEQISDSLDGMGHEVFEAIIILTTVALICSTIIWMKRYSKILKDKLSSIDGSNDSLSSKIMIILLIGTTIFREGSEIVLILYSISAIDGSQSAVYIQGFALGAILGTSVGLGLYYGLFKFATKYIFTISSLVMTFIAAGLAAEAAKILVSVGAIDFLTYRLWDTSFVVSDDTILGKILKIMIGYTSKPTAIELIFYTSVLSLIFFTNQFFSGKEVK